MASKMMNHVIKVTPNTNHNLLIGTVQMPKTTNQKLSYIEKIFCQPDYTDHLVISITQSIIELLVSVIL